MVSASINTDLPNQEKYWETLRNQKHKGASGKPGLYLVETLSRLCVKLWNWESKWKCFFYASVKGIHLKSFLLPRREDIEFLKEARSVHYALIWIMEVILNDTLTTGMLHTLAFWFTLGKGTKDIDSDLSIDLIRTFEYFSDHKVSNLMPYSVLFQSAQCHFNQLGTA